MLALSVADFSYSMDRLPVALLGCAAYSVSGHGVSQTSLQCLRAVSTLAHWQFACGASCQFSVKVVNHDEHGSFRNQRQRACREMIEVYMKW